MSCSSKMGKRNKRSPLSDCSFAQMWDLFWSDAQRIGKDASKKYKDIQPWIVDQAVQETLTLKKWEQETKESVPLFTKLWEEEVRKERDAMEVLIEIKVKDAASFPSSINIIEDHLLRKVKMEDVPFIAILDNIKTYITSRHTSMLQTRYIAFTRRQYLSFSREYSDEELICRFFNQDGPWLGPYTYADYLEEKMQLAANLGLTINESRQQQASRISESF